MTSSISGFIFRLELISSNRLSDIFWFFKLPQARPSVFCVREFVFMYIVNVLAWVGFLLFVYINPIARGFLST